MSTADGASREVVAEFAHIGVTAFTTTRADGDYAPDSGAAGPGANALDSAAAGSGAHALWHRLAATVDAHTVRLASARQVHGARVVSHADDWSGWRRADDADGHWSAARGTACAITVADCVPIFLAQARGAVAILHAGWRGTVARILSAGVDRFLENGITATELHMHLGPAICGRCYRVGADVFEQLTGWPTSRERHVDLRALLAEQAAALGVRHVSVSASCTRCDNDRFYSHRAGDAGRQVAVIATPSDSGGGVTHP